MSTWNAGYVTDIGYTFGYYAELNPLRSVFNLLAAGITPPTLTNACELGFGQGVSVNIHAAATPITWHGTDFNPAQAGFAQELARASQAPAHLTDEAFADFCARDDLPEFDYIGLHGIWSWISDENRHHIVTFLRRKLKVGGVLYVSYNTLPGWAPLVPLRDLLVAHAHSQGGSGKPITKRIDDAIAFAENLIAANPLYTRAYPQVAERLKAIKGQDRNYLAHEYFNRDWHPMNFGTMTDWLEAAKLTYACSAHTLDHVTGINLLPAQRTLLAEIEDVRLRELTRDMIANQQFRRDYWVKGPRALSPVTRADQLRALRFILTIPRDEAKMTIAGLLGEITMTETAYAPLLDALADHKVKSLAELEAVGRQHSLAFPGVLEALLILVGRGDVALAQGETAVRTSRARSDKLNEVLLRKSIDGNAVGYLASPVTGGGIAVSRLLQLFLIAYHQGKRQPDDWVQFAWSILSLQGQRVVHDGKVMETPEENVAELTRQATVFATKQMPIFKGLGLL